MLSGKSSQLISNVYPIHGGKTIIRDLSENVLMSRDLHCKQKWSLQILNINATKKFSFTSEIEMIIITSPQVLISDKVDYAIEKNYNCIATAIAVDGFLQERFHLSKTVPFEINLFSASYLELMICYLDMKTSKYVLIDDFEGTIHVLLTKEG